MVNQRIGYLIDLTLALTQKELKARYKSTTFGFFWMVINPLLQMIILTIVFSVFLRINIPNYPLYVFSGLLPWMFFSLSLQHGTSSLVNNRDLIKKVSFPRELLPISAVLAHLSIFLLSMTLLILISLFVTGIHLTFIFLIPLILLQTLLAIGISLFLSSLEIYYRDISFILQALVLLWFYVTPILYPLFFIPDQYYWLYRLNPMVGIVTAYQGIFASQNYFDIPSLLISLIATGISLFVGYMIFRSRSSYFADWI